MKRVFQFTVVGVVTLIIALGLCSGSANALGAVGAKPGNPDPANPRTHDIFIYTLSPNGTKSDAVVVSNNSKDKKTIDLYTADGVVTNTGAFSCKQLVESKTEVGSWIKLSKNEVTLDPGQNQKVDFTVTVPGKADVGEHNGCLVFASREGDTSAEGSVRIRTRSAIRVAITLPGDLRKQIDISGFDITSTSGVQQYSLAVNNPGNVSADTEMNVQLTSIFGTKVYDNHGTYPVLAGNKYTVNYTNDKLPFWGGWYTVSAGIKYDKRAGVYGAADASYLVNKTAQSKTLFITPSLQAIAIYTSSFIIIVVGVGLAFYRLRSDTLLRENWRRHEIKEGETIQSLAHQYGVSWKKLARINKLKAPYVVEPGSKILLPRKK